MYYIDREGRGGYNNSYKTYIVYYTNVQTFIDT